MTQMLRPDFNEMMAGVFGYLVCGCGRATQTREETYDHWQRGHFDVAVTPDVIRAAVEAEREACAKVAEEIFDFCGPHGEHNCPVTDRIVAAIRARGVVNASA